METKLTLLEAYKQGKIKIGDYIGYTPERKVCVLKRQDTGARWSQTFKTEQLEWRLASVSGTNAMLISEDTSQALIELGGKIGYEEGPKALQKLCKELYSSKKMKAKAICMTEKIFSDLPKELKRSTDKYWLTNRRTSKSHYAERIYWYLRIAGIYDEGICHTAGLILADSDGKEDVYRLAVRPVIYLPYNTLVDQSKKIEPNI